MVPAAVSILEIPDSDILAVLHGVRDPNLIAAEPQAVW